MIKYKIFYNDYGLIRYEYKDIMILHHGMDNVRHRYKFIDYKFNGICIFKKDKKWK
jgi:hypothetical protein